MPRSRSTCARRTAGRPYDHRPGHGRRSPIRARATITDPGSGELDAPVYANELTGDSVLVTVETHDRRIAAKADRHTRKRIGEIVGVKIGTAHIYLFDADTGERVER